MAIVNISLNNFQTEVSASEKPVLLDFYADWCGPCQMLHPELEHFEANTDLVKVGQINVDENGELTAVAIGTTTVRATTRSLLTDSMTIRVVEAPRGLTVDAEPLPNGGRFPARRPRCTRAAPARRRRRSSMIPRSRPWRRWTKPAPFARCPWERRW